MPGSIIDGVGLQPRQRQGSRLDHAARRAELLRRPGRAGRRGGDGARRPVAAPVAPSSYPVAIDGFAITGGVQSDFPANINELTGGIKTPYGAAGALVTQGGGIYVHNNVRNLQVTDNVIRGNGGSYGGGDPGRHAVHRRQPQLRARPWPATRSATTAAPTSPAASGSSPAATATR